MPTLVKLPAEVSLNHSVISTPRLENGFKKPLKAQCPKFRFFSFFLFLGQILYFNRDL